MHCVSNTDESRVFNLATISDLKDITVVSAIAVMSWFSCFYAAVGFGISSLERHVTLDRSCRRPSRTLEKVCIIS